MTRQEAIQAAFDLKKNPSNYEPSNLLYAAVGLVKREKDSGASFAAMQLVSSIKEVYGENLSDFCKRRIDIIEEAHIDRMGKNLTVLAKAYEIQAYQLT